MKNSSILATPANLSTLRGLVSSSSARSAWSRGVRAYALDLIDEIEEIANYEVSNSAGLPVISQSLALNGANDWDQYAYGGCGAAAVYDEAIAERLCTPSELRAFHSGKLCQSWPSVEARALFQAWRLIAENLGKLS